MRSAACATVVSGHYFSGKIFAEGAADIGVATGTDIELVVRTALAATGGMSAYVNNGDTVLIKPNLSFAAQPERAATTNPEVLQSVIKLCLEVGAKKVIIADHPIQNASIIGTQSQVAQVAKENKNTYLILPTSESLFEETPIPEGKEMKATKTAKILKEADVLINLPVAKHHSATFISMGIKGNLGLVWDRIAFHNSGDFNQSLADLATIIKPDLTIVDAIRALTTRGPQGPGKVAKLDTIVAGRDPVAVDAYAVELTPWSNRTAKGSNIKHLINASEMGLGKIDPSQLHIVKRTV